MPLPMHAEFGQGSAQIYSPMLSADASCKARLAWQTCLPAFMHCQHQSQIENPNIDFSGAKQH